MGAFATLKTSKVIRIMRFFRTEPTDLIASELMTFAELFVRLVVLFTLVAMAGSCG